ncbi:large subunit ribosomal protein LP2 [Mytilus galloprovincialis]|uniref:Large ribosomal subunit protein P2 n=1 Tax=Mytilus galloprovincialis TaxID=29158 RepID=A0A8B6HEH4_MYTGA|nr:large subunit ribosomal protein LP2 [Mytilus galloprovincialis]
MRYVAAYMLAVMGGIENPSVDDLKMIIGSVGIDSDNEKINLVISKLKGKNIEELVLKSQGLLASVSGGSESTCNQTGTPQEVPNQLCISSSHLEWNNLRNMRYVAAYMLAVMGGIENPSVDDLKMIIGSVGIDSDNEKINLVISKLKGKNIEELVLKSDRLLNGLAPRQSRH